MEEVERAIMEEVSLRLIDAHGRPFTLSEVDEVMEEFTAILDGISRHARCLTMAHWDYGNIIGITI